MANLTGGNPVTGYFRASGRINQILFDSGTKQIFLLCENGELVTMPDCPRCIKITTAAACGLRHGRIEEGSIEILLADGGKITVPVRDAMQTRVSVGYARKMADAGGRIIDLHSVEPEALPELLEGIPKDVFLGFICEYGVRSDEAARYARRIGYTQAYSLGGRKPAFHVE